MAFHVESRGREQHHLISDGGSWYTLRQLAVGKTLNCDRARGLQDVLHTSQWFALVME